MVMNDNSESVIVAAGCSLELFMHGPRFFAGTGTVHTFTHDDGSIDMPENDNFDVVGLANVVSSWECTCGFPVEHPIACQENETGCDSSYVPTAQGIRSFSVWAGAAMNTFEINGKRIGASGGGEKFDIPLQKNEIILSMDYGINRWSVPNEWVDAICNLKIITNLQEYGPYHPARVMKPYHR